MSVQGLTTAGLAALLTRDKGPATFADTAVGTGSQAFAVGLTALATENARTTVANLLRTGNTLIIDTYFSNALAVGLLSEGGHFDAASGGNLLSYYTYATAAVKTAADAFVSPVAINLTNAPISGAMATVGLTGLGIEKLLTSGKSTTDFAYIAAGSGSSASKTGRLEAYDGLSSELARRATAGPAISGTTATFYGLFEAGVATGTISEIGIYDSLTGGNLLYYNDNFTPLVKAGGDTTLVSITLSLANA